MTTKKKPGVRDENGNLIVPIEIQAWEDELIAEEPEITDFDSVVELRKKLSGGQVARLVGAAQARGDIERVTAAVDALLYQTGIEIDLNSQITAQMETARLENGREIRIRSLTGAVRRGKHEEGNEDDGNEDALLLVESISEKGLERAVRYLHHYVPGYIHGRLALIAANKGNVHEHAEWLIARIREMVEELNGGTIAVVESS